MTDKEGRKICCDARALQTLLEDHLRDLAAEWLEHAARDSEHPIATDTLRECAGQLLAFLAPGSDD